MARIAYRGALDILFPPRCLVCDASAEPFCAKCQETILPVADGTPPPEGLDDVRSVGYHQDALRRAVVRLKFHRKVALVEPLGALLAEELARVQAQWNPDLLLPVPMHWRRQWERGFNQAELLAEEVGRWSGIEVQHALVRRKLTDPQVGLSGHRRRKNLIGAFAPNPRYPVMGKRVVLVDDVRTTGGTVSECAATLRQAGAAQVYALSVTYDV
jgi:ComF family protein